MTVLQYFSVICLKIDTLKFSVKPTSELIAYKFQAIGDTGCSHYAFQTFSENSLTLCAAKEGRYEYFYFKFLQDIYIYFTINFTKVKS